MPDLVIRLKKKNDGSAALSCTRADGSVTWQQQNGAQGRFFPLHDLTHLAVETVLETRRAFYGLLAEGWDLGRFAEPGASMTIPDEAELIEVIVGMFDIERATGERPTADDFAWKIDSYREQHGYHASAFRITDDQIAAIRALRAELFAKWNALPMGETLELPYDRPEVSGVTV